MAATLVSSYEVWQTLPLGSDIEFINAYTSIIASDGPFLGFAATQQRIYSVVSPRCDCDNVVTKSNVSIRSREIEQLRVSGASEILAIDAWRTADADAGVTLALAGCTSPSTSVIESTPAEGFLSMCVEFESSVINLLASSTL